MRLHILSDLHIEFAPFDLPNVNADAVLLAGDVHTGRNGLRWIREKMPTVPVVYVLGNHEFYGQNIPTLVDDLRELAHGTNVSVLENALVEIGDVIFLGATLWTDFQLSGDVVMSQVAAVTNMTDFKRIRVAPRYTRLRPADTRRFHARTLEWLRGACERHSGRRLVVVTHHAPSGSSVPVRFTDHPLNAAYASNLDRFIEQSGASLWVHGHIHERSDYCIGSTRIVANPRGYPDEPQNGFEPGFTLEI